MARKMINYGYVGHLSNQAINNICSLVGNDHWPMVINKIIANKDAVKVQQRLNIMKQATSTSDAPIGTI